MPKMKLSDIGFLSRGKSKHRPRNDQILYGGKYPFIQTSDIKKANHILYTYEQTYNEIGLKQSKLWGKNTICITIAANIADSAILGFEACFPDSIIGLEVNDKIANYHYIEYLLQYYKIILQNQSNGTSQENINLETFEQVYFDIPSLEQQNAISHILYTIDKKIELNDKLNNELEKLAQTLYNYWFVQFDFPDEFGRPYKSSGGKMVYNEVLKREIPEGWTSASLNNICLMYQPQTIGTDQLLPNGKFYVYGANGIIGKYDQYNHVESEIAVACRGNSCGVVNRPLMKSWITGNAMVVQMKDKTIHNEYLYQMLKCINIKRIVTGSGQPQITRANLAPIQVSKPHQDLLLKYSALVASNVTERLRNELENQKLAELRDFLLPMLMNGQVSVKS